MNVSGLFSSDGGASWLVRDLDGRMSTWTKKGSGDLLTEQ